MKTKFRIVKITTWNRVTFNVQSLISEFADRTDYNNWNTHIRTSKWGTSAITFDTEENTKAYIKKCLAEEKVAKERATLYKKEYIEYEEDEV